MIWLRMKVLFTCLDLSVFVIYNSSCLFHFTDSHTPAISFSILARSLYFSCGSCDLNSIRFVHFVCVRASTFEWVWICFYMYIRIFGVQEHRNHHSMIYAQNGAIAAAVGFFLIFSLVSITTAILKRSIAVCLHDEQYKINWCCVEFSMKKSCFMCASILSSYRNQSKLAYKLFAHAVCIVQTLVRTRKTFACTWYVYIYRLTCTHTFALTNNNRFMVCVVTRMREEEIIEILHWPWQDRMEFQLKKF